MMTIVTQSEEISRIAQSLRKQNPEASRRFLERLTENGRALTRDEGIVSHFCVYFLPYNPITKQVFIVHHKKSGLWLSPGGHIDRGEFLFDALNREIKEELGVVNFFSALPQPFLITITLINNPTQPCKEHLDIWFLVETDGSNFKVDPQEFHNTKWLNFEDARKIIVDSANLEAIKILQK